MLVLTRKGQQQIRIGDDIEITVLAIKGSRVQIGVTANADVRILRGELNVAETGDPPPNRQLVVACEEGDFSRRPKFCVPT